MNTLMLRFAPVDKPLLFALYKVAYEVAKMKKPHIVLETLSKPCGVDMMKTMMVRRLQKKTATDSFVRQCYYRIDDIGTDFLDQVLSDIKPSSTKI